MKNNIFKKSFSIILSLLMIFSLAAEAIAADAPTSPADGKVYFISNVNSDAQLKDLATYYDYDQATDTYTRTAEGDMYWNIREDIPYIPIGYLTGNYILDFDFQYAASDLKKYQQWPALLIGGDETGYGWNNDSNALVLSFGEGTTGSADETGETQSMGFHKYSKDKENNVTQNNWGNGFTINIAQTAHAKVTVLGQKIIFDITTALGTVTNTVKAADGFDGGLVALGVSNKGFKFSNITVSEFDETQYAFNGNWFSDRSPAAVTNYYDVADGKYIRKGSTDSNGWGSSPTIFFGNAKNFKLDFDYTYNTTDTEEYFGILYGVQNISSAALANGSVALYFGKNASNTNNILYSSVLGNVWGDNGTFKTISGAYRSFSYVQGATYHLTITVENGVLSLEIKDSGGTSLWKTTTYSAPAAYKGGWIGISAAANGSSFSNVEITEITPTDRVYYGSAWGATNTYNTLETYYTVSEDGNTYTRKSGGNGWGTTAGISLGSYKNFKLEFDFDYTGMTSIVDNSMVWVTVGDADIRGQVVSQTKFALGLRNSRSGYIYFYPAGNTAVASCWLDSANQTRGGVYTGNVATNADYTLKHHAVITVNDNFVVVDIDNGKTVRRYELETDYAGGFVKIGNDAPGLSMSNITIEEIEKDNIPFTAYYSADIGSYTTVATSATSADLTKESLSDRWSWDGNVLTYKKVTSGNGWNKNISVAYLNKQEYTDFDLTFDYWAQENYIYVGFGAEMGKSWMADKKDVADRVWSPDAGNHIISLNTGGSSQYGPVKAYIEGTSDPWYFDGWFSTSLPSDSYVNTSWHTAKVSVRNGKAYLWKDGVYCGNITLNNYDGGYVYFGTNATGAAFRNINIVLSSETTTSDFTGYTAYHWDDLSTGEAGTTGLEVANSDWQIVGNTITRKWIDEAHVETDKGGTQWAQLYLNTPYENFVLEADVTAGLDAWTRAYIGFGAKMGVPMKASSGGGIAFHRYNNGYYANIAGQLWNTEGYSYEWGNKEYITGLTEEELAAAAFSGTVHVKIVVNNRMIEVYYNDDTNPICRWTCPDWYGDGGYIYFASNSSQACFANVTVTKQSAYEIVEDEILNGKSALFVGDSICVGANDIAMAYGWGGRIGRTYGMEWINEGHGGATFSTGAGVPSILEQITRYDSSRNLDYIVLQGGVNDVMRNVPLGAITNSYDSEFDTTTFAGAFEYALAYVTENWPEAKIGYIVTFQTDWGNATKEITAPYYNVARAICQKWNVPYLDLNGENVKEALDPATRKGLIWDGIHPSGEGYDALVEGIIDEWMRSIPVWGTLKNYSRADYNKNGVCDAMDLAFLRKELLNDTFADVDFGYLPDINCTLLESYELSAPIDLNGDNVFNLVDFIRAKKIAAGIAK